MAASAPSLIAVIDQVPGCVRQSTIDNVGHSGCADLGCVCQNDEVLTKLLYDLLRKCNPTDQETGFEVAQNLCMSIVPSLQEDNRQTEIIAIVAAMTVISTLAVILRLIARRISAAGYGADDFLIVIALFLTYALDANEIVALRFGFGKHQLSLPLHHIEMFLLNDWTVQMVFATAISTTRFSLLFFYHRFFPVRRFNIFAIITGCILIGWWISFCFVVIFSCYPVKSYWDKSIPGHCLNEHTLSWGLTGSELVANIIMVILPIPWLWHLRLPWSKKLALIGLFMLGCFVCISCIVRFPLLAQVVQTDASYTIVPAGAWIIVECNIGIASVCLPLLRPLLSHPLSSFRVLSPFQRSGCTHPTTHTFSDEEKIMSSDEEIPFDGSVPNHSQLYNVLRGHPPDGVVRDTRTYRSRIESYSPDFLEAETKKMQQRQSRPRSRSRSRPQHRSRPRSRPHQHPPHSHSHSHPLAQPKRKASEARPYNARYSQEQMSEMYKKWYQGRGSEVGRGLWQVEMNKAARKDQGLDRRRNAVVHWEPEEDAAQGKNLDVVTKPNPVL